MRWHDVALTWNLTKDHNRSRKLCLHHPGHVPVICGNLDLHFEGTGNCPVVISWIGRDHELYSGASPILIVEHCVTFRHDRRLLSLLGFAHNWTTSRWSATKKKTSFHLTEMESCRLFQGDNFIVPPYIYIYMYIYVCVCVCLCVHGCVGVFVYTWVCLCVRACACIVAASYCFDEFGNSLRNFLFMFLFFLSNILATFFVSGFNHILDPIRGHYLFCWYCLFLFSLGWKFISLKGFIIGGFAFISWLKISSMLVPILNAFS